MNPCARPVPTAAGSPTTEIVLALHDGDGTTGDYSYTCPQCTRWKGEWVDEYVYAILAREWLKRPATG